MYIVFVYHHYCDAVVEKSEMTVIIVNFPEHGCILLLSFVSDGFPDCRLGADNRVYVANACSPYSTDIPDLYNRDQFAQHCDYAMDE